MTSPIPWGSVRTINALSKCHGPPDNTLFLSVSSANLNMKILFPKLSILTSLNVLHTYCNAALSPSLLTPLDRRTLPIKHPASILSFLVFKSTSNVTLALSSSRIFIALHLRINSSVSMVANERGWTNNNDYLTFPPRIFFASPENLANRTKTKNQS